MRGIGISTVLAELTRCSRENLQNAVVAGFIRWEGAGGPVTKTCLMCFKTGTAMEVMLCEDSACCIPSVTQIAVAPLLQLRKKINYNNTTTLKTQLKYDKRSAKYLHKVQSVNRDRMLGGGEPGTCQICTIL
jgi:hypothetical protein